MPVRQTRQIVTAFILMVLMPLAGLTQKDSSKEKDKSKDRNGTPVLWTAPDDIASRDLFLGPGGEEMKPDLSSITFVDDKKGGHSTKYNVTDGAGKRWVAKVGVEAQPETAAVRLLWAIGYVSEINYLVPHVAIQGKGTFDNVRFEARPEHIKRTGNWDWEDNPFIGTKEFQGLKVMMLLFDNWDIKNSNNQILYVPGDNDQANQLQYIISDLGSTFGKTGGSGSRSRNKPVDFAKVALVKRVDNSQVKFKYNGKEQKVFEDITVDQVKWVAGLLSQLTEKQIRDAFRSANYDRGDIDLLYVSFRDRIKELTDIQ